jgi:hypothetical protein
MPDLVRRAATAVEALRPDYFERRHRLVPELAQLVGRQRSRIDAGRLAVLIHFLGRPKWTTVVSALRCLQWLYARSRRALASTSSVYWALTPANPVLRACPPSTAELPDWSELRSDEAGTATPGAIMSFLNLVALLLLPHWLGRIALSGPSMGPGSFARSLHIP